MNTNLREFSRDALSRGIAREDIARALRQAGWAEEDIQDGLGAFAEVDFAIPVPRRRPYLTAYETFLYLVLFTALYACAINVGSIAFEFIEYAFPDQMEDRTLSYVYKTIRLDVSSLIIAFPVFLYVFRVTSTVIAREPHKRESPPRKYLTYLTLFLGACVLCGDLVTLVHSFLGGELTIRIGLKALTVAILAGGTFLYFLVDIRREET